MPRRRGDSGNGRIGKNGKDDNDGKGGKGGKTGKGSENQSTLSTISSADERLEVSTLETWLWDAACAIRGATDAPKFKDFILPLIFFKRLSDVFDDEFAKHVADWDDDVALARQIVEDDRSHSLRSGTVPIIRFYVPQEFGWNAVRNHGADGLLGEFVTSAMREVARHNPDLKGVLDIKDYNERQSGQRTLDDDRLAGLIEILSRHRLGLKNTEADILGRAYEYLLRKFAEGQGQSAGEFYTPKEVGELIAELIDPQPFSTIYDPACGSGGLLIKPRLAFERSRPEDRSRAPRLYGQELNPVTFAMAKMNMFLHGYTNSGFAIGDTLRKPGFGSEGKLLQFDRVVTNPMWNQEGYEESFYENDNFSRFSQGTPPRSSADWGWVQHVLASLKPGGRAAVVLDTGAVSRGSGSRSANKEKKIRQSFVENDFIEGVVLLPENLFYNTTAPGIVLLLCNGKPEERKGQMLLVNASAYFVKEKPKNVLTPDGIRAIAEAYGKWESRERLCRVITLDEAREADFNLSPSQFVEVNEREKHRPIPEILADLARARTERERADGELGEVLGKLRLI